MWDNNLCMSLPHIVLKPGKDEPVRGRHHWIFSGAIAWVPDDVQAGDLVLVESSAGEILGQAYYHPDNSIAARMISWDEQPIEEVLSQRITAAISWRQTWFGTKQTNTYRLIHGEGDFLPGLTVDRYGEVLVIQITTLGMDRLRELIIKLLVEQLHPAAIWEKSDTPSRAIEGLSPVTDWVYGKPTPVVVVEEEGLKYQVDFDQVQKTGLFLDQREMRQLVRSLATGKSVLNCFAYTGGFSLAALQGGAKQVETVDVSATAMAGAKQNFELNGFSVETNSLVAQDVFSYLREQRLDQYDLIILDPPAFAKKRSDVSSAMKAYRDINRLAITGVAPGGMVITSSCSALVDEKLFQKVVWQAAKQSGRQVRIIQKHCQAADHPANIYQPETEYLKSLVLYVE